MNKITRFKLNKYLLFQSFDWDIASSPLWVIRGENKDSTNTGRQHSGNAVGKSLIFNALASLWLAQPPFSTKKNSAKDLVPKSGSSILYGVNGKTKYKITQRHNSKLDYEISLNGKDLKIKDIAEQRKAIGRLLKLNADHFYSFVYVHSFRPSTLQIGTAAQRYDFIESLFNLRIYDVINKKLLKIANGQKLSRMQLPKLVGQKKEITITPKQQKELSEKLKTIKTKLEERITKLEKLNSTLAKYNTLVTLFSSLKSDKTKSLLKDELKITRKSISKVEDELETLQRDYGRNQLAQELEETRNGLLERKAKYAKILRNNHEFTDKDQEDAERRLEDLANVLYCYESSVDTLTAYKKIDIEATTKKADSILEDRKNTHNLIEAIESAINDRKEKLSVYSNVLSEMSRLAKHVKCPTCRQTISEETINRLTEDAKEKRAKVSAQVSILKDYGIIQFVNELDSRLRNQPIEELEEEFKDAKELLSQIQESIYVKEKLNSVQVKLDELPKMSKVEVSKEDLVTKKKKLSSLQTQAEFLTSELSVHERLDKEYSKEERESIRERYKTLKATSTSLSDSILPLNETVQKLSVAVSTGKIAVDTHERLKQEIKEIERETEDYDLIQTLVEIYSPKGVRIQHIETLVNSFISLMNQYSTSIFSETVIFSSQIKSSQFSVLADRRGKVSDVNSLSGSESRQFAALSALVLRMLMPKELVPNILVFDEVEAGMSKTNRDLFFAHFVPIVQQFVPTVIIVTPHDSSVVSIPNATTLLLERRKGITTARVGI
jgi:DNA repair exonuclease SbcCD ATPase subunit